MPVALHTDRFRVLDAGEFHQRQDMLDHALGLAQEVLSLRAAVAGTGNGFPILEADGSGDTRLPRGEPDNRFGVECLLLTAKQDTQEHLAVLV